MPRNRSVRPLAMVAGLLIAAGAVVAVRALPAFKGQAHDDGQQTATLADPARTQPRPQPEPTPGGRAARAERSGEGGRPGGARDEDRRPDRRRQPPADRIIVDLKSSPPSTPAWVDAATGRSSSA